MEQRTGKEEGERASAGGRPQRGIWVLFSLQWGCFRARGGAVAITPGKLIYLGHSGFVFGMWKLGKAEGPRETGGMNGSQISGLNPWVDKKAAEREARGREWSSVWEFEMIVSSK